MRILVPALAAMTFAFGCVAPTRAGEPIALFPASADQSAVWVVRAVNIPSQADASIVTKVYGLFACYRPSTPGQPQCFMASYAWTPDDLYWPSGASGTTPPVAK